MDKQNLTPWRGLGSFIKATEDDAGNLFIVFHVSGPKKDADGETLSKDGEAALVEAANAGFYDLTPSHNIPISLGKSVEGWAANHDVYMKFHMDKSDPWAVKLHKGVADGSFKGQVSVGGKCLRDRLAKTFTPVANQDIPGHVALTMPGMAAYPDAGPVAALTKAIAEGNVDSLEWSAEKKAVAKEALAKGLYEVSTMATLLANLASVQAWVEQEAEQEGDGSTVPAELKTVIKSLAAVFSKMAAEEASEAAGTDEEDNLEEGRDPDETDLLKRKYSAKQRKALAAKGHAMPGGRYPINDREDLENAIQAYGRGKDKPEVKAWIKKRAKALGAEDLLPESWGSGKEREKVETDLEKVGKRNSDADQKRIQAMHDTAVELGADCPSADDGSTEEDSGKARRHVEGDLAKTLSGLGVGLSDLVKTVGTIGERLAGIEGRLTKVEGEPVPPKGAINAQAPVAIEKAQDATRDDLEKGHEIKTAADAIRAAHAHPFTKFVTAPK